MVIVRRLDALAWSVVLGSSLLSASCGSSGSGSSSPGGAGSSGASSSGGSSATGSGGKSSSSVGGSGSGAPLTACPTAALPILFSPMYSAWDGVHTFQIPAVVNGITPGAVDINWSASDPSMVKLDTDPTTGEVTITTQKSGVVTIIASAGSLCGASVLTITDATTDAAAWQLGSDRYNDGVTITQVPGMGGRGRGAGAGGAGGAAGGGGAGGVASAADAACTNCHGDNATNLIYKTVQHTPRQTGGFSDKELTNIFENGMVPTGPDGMPIGFSPIVGLTYATWQQFHKWNVGDAGPGLVTYLRSLTPAVQTGVVDFGGRQMGGGGAGGGRNMGMGGGRNGGGRGGAGGGVAAAGASGAATSGGSAGAAATSGGSGGAAATSGGSGGASAGADAGGQPSSAGTSGGGVGGA